MLRIYNIFFSLIFLIVSACNILLCTNAYGGSVVAEPVLETITINYADPEEIKTVVAAFLSPDDAVVVQGNKIILKTNQKNFLVLKKLISNLDVAPTILHLYVANRADPSFNNANVKVYGTVDRAADQIQSISMVDGAVIQINLTSLVPVLVAKQAALQKSNSVKSDGQDKLLDVKQSLSSDLESSQDSLYNKQLELKNLQDKSISQLTQQDKQDIIDRGNEITLLEQKISEFNDNLQQVNNLLENPATKSQQQQGSGTALFDYTTMQDGLYVKAKLQPNNMVKLDLNILQSNADQASNNAMANKQQRHTQTSVVIPIGTWTQILGTDNADNQDGTNHVFSTKTKSNSDSKVIWCKVEVAGN